MESIDFVLPRQFVRMCRRNMRRPKIADTSGLELTGGGLLTSSLALRRVLRRESLAAGEIYVGILLPPSVAAVLANSALSLDRRVPVNLNYTVSSEVLNGSIAHCGIRHVLTSRQMLERCPLTLDADLIFVEDLKQRVTPADKLLSAAAARLPAALLAKMLGLNAVKPDDVATVIFTSGSTGIPKGVMLTHGNIASNLNGFAGLLQFRDSDCMLGVLPLFHAFGYTCTLWTVLTLGPRGVYHYTPLEARQIGGLCRKHGCTILIATPTFLRSYLRRCGAEELRSLEVVVTGAEQLPQDLATAFEEKFGVLPVEGYGTTELSPVVGVNRPPSRDTTPDKRGNHRGTIGRPLAGIDVKVIDIDTGADLPAGKQGMLLVRGPNVMKGYLHRADLTAEVMRGDWYVTGDLATIDAENYVSITGRISRFSKIAGEMVPHLRVQEAVGEVISAANPDVQLAVTAVRDAARGERLVVLHTGLALEPAEICRQLKARGIPPLWIPSPDSFRRVESIPILGTGKLDLAGLKAMAEEQFGQDLTGKD